MDWGDGDLDEIDNAVYQLIFQYPLVDWGDGDNTEKATQALRDLFQYPLVDWGDGDTIMINPNGINAPISVSSGGLG